MTVEGAMQKTGLLMAVAMVAAAHTWMQIFSGNSAAAMAALSTSKVDGEACRRVCLPAESLTTSPLFSGGNR